MSIDLNGVGLRLRCKKSGNLFNRKEPTPNHVVLYSCGCGCKLLIKVTEDEEIAFKVLFGERELILP